MAKYSTKHTNQGLAWQKWFRVLNWTFGLALTTMGKMSRPSTTVKYRGTLCSRTCPRDVFGLRNYPDGHSGYYRNSICPEDGIILYRSRTENLKHCNTVDMKNIPPGPNRSREVLKGRDRFDSKGMFLKSRPKSTPLWYDKNIPGGFWNPVITHC